MYSEGWVMSFDEYMYSRYGDDINHFKMLDKYSSGNYKDEQTQVAFMAFSHQQKRVDELERELSIGKAVLESERHDREAGFKIFFQATDISGRTHGYDHKPYFEESGYWGCRFGGKKHYMCGGDWLSMDKARKSLVSSEILK